MSINAYPEAAQVVRIMPSHSSSATGSVPVTSLKTACSTCHLRELCLPCGMTGIEVERLDELRFGRRRIKTGETLYRQGDPFKFIYAIRRGTLKSSLTLADGREQVSGFHLAGEQLGLDGVALGKHGTTAVALEDTEVCAIPYAHMANLIVTGSITEHLISRLMSREIVREHSLMMLLGSMNAEERLATFLLNLAGRLKARGYSASEFHLRMTRAEIGSHLGLKLETISRTFSAFQKQGLLEVDKRHIRIIDVDGLNHALGMRMH
jgi:CRP/FNR family transcriptional regulator, anaerobic regulatory protein